MLHGELKGPCFGTPAFHILGYFYNCCANAVEESGLGLLTENASPGSPGALQTFVGCGTWNEAGKVGLLSHQPILLTSAGDNQAKDENGWSFDRLLRTEMPVTKDVSARHDIKMHAAI